jgi:predicted  nucleic acid-binding Zn-ribbon protein
MRKCPKCGERVSPLYFKTACKSCGADLLYYHFDERLEQDAQKAAAQEEKVRRLVRKLPFQRGPERRSKD